LCVCILGIITERLFIRPALNSSLISIIIITIGISIVYQSAAMLIWGKDALILQPFSETEFIELSEETILNVQNIWILGITIFFMIILHLFFEKTITGKAFTACSSNPAAAALVGIDRNKMVLLSFAISAGLSGIAGAVLCPLTNASYGMGVSFGLKGFCAAIVGGLGNNIGAILGGFMLGIIQEMGAGFISSGYKDAISFSILIIFLIFKPSGILGSKWKKRV
ncbi:branched-chain amino acid ABC transporter permease, partial [Candidatus Dependentiae bacterium]|nr:branched-chain amino acid ABC transporter permease [Candidatus Dependentiae bacterium]